MGLDFLAGAPGGLLGVVLALGIGVHLGWRFARASQHIDGLIANHLPAINDAADPAITVDD